eukprot:TRINITY_DN63_c0_g1_i3.p1 TRINITY_DN63_c0_g1~~TRINITY_DN63_c0_g1_i3.p1  ORF type:complete len:1455 (+),score=172.02 TRINITY_DN63_c0_g1_i3:111-4475(+)
MYGLADPQRRFKPTPPPVILPSSHYFVLKRSRRSVAVEKRRRLAQCGDIHPNPGPNPPKLNLKWKTGPPNIRPTSLRPPAASSKGPLPKPPPPAVAKPPDIRLMSLNITNLKNRLNILSQHDVEITCLQETALTEFNQYELNFQAQYQKYLGDRRLLWGPPQPGKVYHEAAAPNTAQRGGVGILVKKNFMAVKDLSPLVGEAPTTRRVHAKVALDKGSSWLHIFTLYCDVHSKAEREDLLSNTFYKICRRLGDVPIIVTGDFNTSVQDSPTLTRLTSPSSSWVDVSSHFSNGSPPATYVTATANTRPDYIFANTIAMHGLTGCRTVDVQAPSHRALIATLNIPLFRQTTYRYSIPREIPDKPRSLPAPPATDIMPTLVRYKQINDLDGAFLALSACCEKYLLWGTRQLSDRGYHGRGAVTPPSAHMIVAPCKSTSLGATTTRFLTLDNLRIGANAFLHRLEGIPHLAPLPHELQKAWKNLVKKAFKMNILSDSDPTWPGSERASTVVYDVLGKVKQQQHDLNIAAKMYRDRKSRAANNAEFHSHRKSLTSFLKNSTSEPACVVRTPDGLLSASVNDMDRAFREAWNPIFRMYDDAPEPTFEPFMQAFGSHIVHHPMTLGNISVDELRKVLAKKKGQGCAGTDGWRLCEIARLPDHLLAGFAFLYDWIEAEGRWPRAVLTALISMLPKSSSDDPLDHRPITVTSAFYRLWACVRLPHIMKWQEGWIDLTQFGFRTGYGVDDLLLDLSSQVEEALLKGPPLYGISIDFKKCFDSVPHEVTFTLMEKLGLSPLVLKPIIGIYRNLQRRLRFPLGVGSSFQTTNGILQGCPISPVFINALIATVTKECRSSVDGTIPLSYADDLYFISRISEGALQRSMLILDKFCSLSGFAIHFGKTKFFCTLKGRFGKVHMRGHRFETVDKHRVLGVNIRFHRFDKSACHDDLRVDNVLPMVERLQHTNLNLYRRATLITECILPSALYGCLYAPPSRSRVDKLKKATISCLWGPDHPMRSVDALLGVAFRGHTHEPFSAINFRIMTTVHRVLNKTPSLRDRFQTICDAYIGAKTLPQGPIGVISAQLQSLGSNWNGFVQHIVPLAKEQAAHEIRALSKNALRRDLQKHRPSYQGLTDIDEKRTNALHTSMGSNNVLKARRVLNIIVGAVFPFHPSVTNEQVGSLVRCLGCDHLADVSEHTTALLDHTLWSCPAHDSIRKSSNIRASLLAEQSEWPQCTRLHGIITKSSKLRHYKELQLMLAEIGGNLRSLFAQKQSRDCAAHMWRRDIPVGPLLLPKTYRWYKEHGLPKTYGEQLMVGVIAWLGALRWGKTGPQVSKVELAIDFMATTGLELDAGKDVTAAARKLGYILAALDRIHARHCETPLIPAEHVASVHSLRTIGITGHQIRGYATRPTFASDTTVNILEKQLFPHCCVFNTLNGFIPKFENCRLNKERKHNAQLGSIVR